MRSPGPAAFQPSLFGPGEVSFAPGFAGIERIALDARSWIDFLPGWVRGADVLFTEVLHSRHWGQRTRKMYDKTVLEPRLTAPWNLRTGQPLQPAILDGLRRSLGARYGVEFDSIGFNYYRDGDDSVAWHGDRIRREIEEPVVALVSLGEPRKFLVRPRGGGPSRAFQLGHGDLLVTGGRTQRDYDHAVPKVARAGPRISLAFRYGMSGAVYDDHS